LLLPNRKILPGHHSIARLNTIFDFFCEQYNVQNLIFARTDFERSKVERNDAEKVTYRNVGETCIGNHPAHRHREVG